MIYYAEKKRHRKDERERQRATEKTRTHKHREREILIPHKYYILVKSRTRNAFPLKSIASAKKFQVILHIIGLPVPIPIHPSMCQCVCVCVRLCLCKIHVFVVNCSPTRDLFAYGDFAMKSIYRKEKK